jgi:hypothetical protein
MGVVSVKCEKSSRSTGTMIRTMRRRVEGGESRVGGRASRQRSRFGSSLVILFLTIVTASAAAVDTPARAADPRSDPSARGGLDWSEAPGTFEQELMRRQGNPLYAPPRQRIGRSELLAAKRRDAEGMWKSLELYIDLATAKKRMARLDDANKMGAALLDLDRETLRALEVGGEAYRLANALQGISGWLLGEWKTTAGDDPDISALVTARKRVPKIDSNSQSLRFIAQLEMGDGPIQTFERAAALLSLDKDTIKQVMTDLGPKWRSKMAKQSQELAADLGAEGVAVEGINSKVDLVRRAAKSSSASTRSTRRWRERSRVPVESE